MTAATINWKCQRMDSFLELPEVLRPAIIFIWAHKTDFWLLISKSVKEQISVLSHQVWDDLLQQLQEPIHHPCHHSHHLRYSTYISRSCALYGTLREYLQACSSHQVRLAWSMVIPIQETPPTEVTTMRNCFGEQPAHLSACKEGK